MSRQSTWHNADGLAVGYGTHTVDNNLPVMTRTSGKVREIHLPIPDLTALSTAATADSGIYGAGKWANAATIPYNASIQQVTIVTRTAATSDGSADLLLGTYTLNNSDGLLDVIDVDSIAAAGDSALTDFSVAGESLVLIKGTGAITGATLVHAAGSATTPVIVAPVYVTAAFTAGALDVYIEYILAE